MIYEIPATAKAIFFDLNGTLIRDRAAHIAAFDRIFAEYGVHLSAEERERKVANRLNREIWPAVLGGTMSEAELEAISIVKERAYVQLAPGLAHPVPGSLELITQLKRHGIYVCLVTSAPSEVVEYALHYLHLEGMLDGMVTASEIHRSKPDPEAYLLALKLSRVSSDTALAFEDSPQGVQAAAAAGIAVVGVVPEYPEAILRNSGACAVVSDFFEVQLQAF